MRISSRFAVISTVGLNVAPGKCCTIQLTSADLPERAKFACLYLPCDVLESPGRKVLRRCVAEKTQKTEAKGAAELFCGAAMAPGSQLGEDSAGGGSVHPGSDEDVRSPLCSTCRRQSQVLALLETTLDLQKQLQETK
ncbi:uncharacterized protein LJ206_015974 isoform 1-T1 [Theristicus caerulescens]